MSCATRLPACLLATCLLTATFGPAAPAQAPLPGHGPRGVSLGRDAHGVAHVFATTDAGAYFGAGYAAAEDRLFQMCWMRLVVQGRVAEFFGPGTVVNPQNGSVKKTHVVSDHKARTFGWTKHADRVVAQIDAPTRKLLQAYADGVNARMQEPGVVHDPLFAQNGVPLEPWTPADCIGAWLRLGEFFGSNGLDEAKLLHEWQVLLATPGMSQRERMEELLGTLVCDDSAAVVQQADVPLATQDLLASYARAHGLTLEETCVPYAASPHFSQAWAVDGAHTTTGRAVLVGDPRIGVTMPSQLYEWSMSGRTFHVKGVGVPGCPNVLSGTTGEVGWSPTALGLDQSDLLLLHTDPIGHPGRYELDGQWLAFENVGLETIHVRGESDVFVLYRETYWGPVVTPVVTNVHAGEEYAVRRVPFDDPARDPARGFVELYRARDIDAFAGRLEGWTWPSVNLVFADTSGRVGYSVVGTVPVRNPKLVLAGAIAQDGSTLASEWLDVLPQPLKPQLLDPAAGYVFSANHRPIGTWYPIPIRYGTGGSGDTLRSRRLRERLAANPQFVSPQEVQQIHFDTVGVGPRDFTEIGSWLKANGVALSLDARRALTELAPWLQAGAKMDNLVRGVLVASFLDLTFREQDAGPELLLRYGGGDGGLNLFLKQVLAKIHALPPLTPTPAEIAYVDRVLAGALQKALLVGPTSVWQAWYAQNVLTVPMPLWTSLEGFPSLTPAQIVPLGPFRAVDMHTLLSPLRQSFTQFLELGAPTLDQSVAPPGVAEPTPHHETHQMNLWVTEQLKPSPRTLQELLRLGGVQWKHF